MNKSSRNKIGLRPLCAFCLSPQFSIRPFFRLPESSSGCRSIRGRRHDGCFLPSIRPRFKTTKRRSTSILNNLTGVLANRGKILSLQEVLGIIQEVWRPPHHVESFSSAVMEENLKKSSSISNENSSPMLLRRRLSAPETIMRKHVLALERSDSQDSEATHSSDSKCQETGSDLNLSLRYDPNQMRKSTLLRRLWSNSRPSFTNSKFPGTFYEWQYGKLSTGKSTHSLTSIQSSPERLIRSQSKKSLNNSPQHKNSSRKLSSNSSVEAKKQIGNNNNVTSKRKISVYENYSTSFSDETAMSNYVHNSTSTVTPKTETSARGTNTSYTTFSDNSDSAYTNSRSNYSNNNSTTPEIQKRIIEEAEVQNEDLNQTDNLRNQEKLEKPQYIKYSSSVNESSTQTVEKTNVNVISNVQLSQSTLDLIFNQVMQDVRTSSPVSDSNQNQTESKIINVQQVPSFYLKPKDSVVDNPQHNRIVKYMISNVGTGSPYSKPAEVPQVVVPRFSALPRTASMEVNISSGDSTDRESDSVSLADSLEDSSFLRLELDKIREEKSGELPVLLPDNSAKKLSKPTAFFIPIELKDQAEFKAVSDHLPDKVRDKLAKRQQKREEKFQAKSKHSSPRSDSNYVSASDNGNQVHLPNGSDVNSNNLPRVNYIKGKKRKPLLPSIKTFRRIKVDKSEDMDQKVGKSVKRKSVSRENSLDIKSKQWVSRNRSEKLAPVYTTKSEYVYNDDGPKKFYHKTEYNDSNKRIEILEIMECVESVDKRQLSKGKSRIPVLINKLPKMESRAIKPTFLDLNCAHITDPKFDQLIANILIETLNSPNLDEVKPELKNSPKYQQKFDAIPEELSLSNEETHDSRNNNASETGENSSYKGKAAVAVVRDENFASIPKGWITFYMLHKNRGSPDSTSDEGKKSDNAKNGKTNKEANNIENNDNPHDIELRNNFKNDTNSNLVRNGNCETNYSSSSDIKTRQPPILNARQRKYNQRKQKRDLGEWSVTVSGTNSYGQFAPDLEMCLKFPDKHFNGASQSDSGLGDDNEKKLQFPRITNKLNRHNKLADDSETPYLRQRLPEIEPNKLVRQQRNSGVALGGAIPSRFEPRQTRTSLRRYNLSRPKIEYNPLPDSPRSNFNIFDERHYAEILKHFPEILTITGNAINSDRSKDPY